MRSETLTQILITNPDKNPDEIPEVFVVSGSTLVASGGQEWRHYSDVFMCSLLINGLQSAATTNAPYKCKTVKWSNRIEMSF